MAVKLLARLASRAEIPVFCLVGNGGRGARRKLLLEERIRLVRSPRHAAILVVAGEIVSHLSSALQHVHDQLPDPRAVLLWNCDGVAELFADRKVVSVHGEHVPLPALLSLYHDLLAAKRPSCPPFGPADNPVSWQGKGDYGQGGKGMMGGTPYGRAMGMTMDDLRDGLQLGSTKMSLGPFLPWLASGLRLRLTLQGDVIQQLSCLAPAGVTQDLEPAFVRAQTEEVRIATIEMARARHHLRAVADLLFLLEMDGYGRQVLRLAEHLMVGQTRPVVKLERSLRRTGLFLWATGGVGDLRREEVSGLGLVARSAGHVEDARRQDPAYAGLGFSPLVRQEGDAAAICLLRLAEAVQAIELAARAGGRLRQPGAPLEGPWGVEGAESGERWQALVQGLAKGMSWDTFVTLLVCLDLDGALLPAAEEYPADDSVQEDEEQDEEHSSNHQHD